MSFREALVSSLENIAAHKLRSVLTMLGMIFGVGAVIAMLSIGEGAEREALAMIETAVAARKAVSVGLLVERLGRLSDARMREICAALAVAADCR